MSHFHAPTRVLCLSCGALDEFAEGDSIVCACCGVSIDRGRILQLYEYAAEVYYYGHQYRVYYEGAYRSSKNPPKPSLGFAGEAFAWVTLAVLSGVLGNAAYDAIKVVVAKIREDVAAGRLPARDYSRLLELTDEQLGELIGAARTYCDGMEGLTREVRAAIAEEIVADTVSHDPMVAAEMMKLMQRKDVKQKHRKRFAELLRGAIARGRDRTQPPPKGFDNLWSRLGK
jgi:hypothetical protein